MDAISETNLRSLIKMEGIPMMHFCLSSFNEPIVPFKAFTVDKLIETVEEVTRDKLTQNLIVSIDTKEVKIEIAI
jgi:hypothetical protein